MTEASGWALVALVAFTVLQLAYLGGSAVTLWLRTRPVNWVEGAEDVELGPGSPRIMMLYPVLREDEGTMRTTMTAMAELDYPADRYRVVAIPNADDHATVESLRAMAEDFPFLEVLPVPATSDPSWAPVWSEWDTNSKAYWWHVGRRAGVTELPPKKTRQLVYALYTMFDRQNAQEWLLSYTDADSIPPRDLFRQAAAGIRDHDVLQSTNVAGNLRRSLASGLHAMDHLSWDGSLYPHLSADGRQPYWVLGKGLFFRVRDLLSDGGFHPWLTIEDPEVGMRMWTEGRRLGVIRSALVEEVPDTFSMGITQRKRWVAGFFQSLHAPLTLMGMTAWQRFRARLNFVPCLSLLLNPVGLPVGVLVVVLALTGEGPLLPVWAVVLAVLSIVLALATVVATYRGAWRQSEIVLPRRRDRLRYLLVVNPVVLLLWWVLWSVPLVIGFTMFVRDTGLAWERTEKKDQNRDLVLGGGGPRPAGRHAAPHAAARRAPSPGRSPGSSPVQVRAEDPEVREADAR